MKLLSTVKKSLFYLVLLVHFSAHAGEYQKLKSPLSDTLDAVHYKIHLQDLNFQTKSITAFTEIQLKSKINNLNHITLELMDLNVDSVFINGLLNAFTQNDLFLYIPLNTPLNQADEVNVLVYYHGVPFHEGWGGFHWSGDYVFNLGVGFESDPHNLGKTWFPCIDDFIDRAAYEVYVTLPLNKKAICGGLLQSVVNNGNETHTFHWKMNREIPTYLASVAAGIYTSVRDTFDGIQGQIPIEIAIRPADSIKVAGSFANLKPILTNYETRFGPYLWERVGYTGTALGAMEHATNTFYLHSSITGNSTNEWLYAHELAHSFFGNLITCASAEDMWINEGWAVFCESMYREDLYGRAAYKQNMREKHKYVLQYSHVDDAGYYPLFPVPTQLTYGTTVYQKGGSVVHTLRNYLGDEIFFDAVKALLDQYKFSPVSSYEMRDFFTSSTGIDMTDFFDAWVFTPGFPHFSIDLVSILPSGNQWQAETQIRQKHKGTDHFSLSNKVEIMFVSESWTTETRTVQFSGELGMSTFLLPFEPIAWFIDYEDKMCDATTDYDTVLKTLGEHNFPETFCKLTVQNLVDSAWVRVTHNWVPPDPMINCPEGLTLSDYRYWNVAGIIPDNFQIRGAFQYNKYGYLDNNLITNQNDSLIILYRTNSGQNWQQINFEKYGSPFTGYIYVDDLQPGEYTLAVWDQTYVKAPSILTEPGSKMSIFPNPSDEFRITLNFHQSGLIQIVDTSGHMIQTLNITNDQNSISWRPQNLKPGSYIVKLIDISGNLVESQKVVIK